MEEQGINKDYLLLLVNNNGYIDTTNISIDKHFEHETIELQNLCKGSEDNIDKIIQFIHAKLKPKLPNKVFNYCQELDLPFQSVHVNIEDAIKDLIFQRDLIYTNQRLAIESEKEYNFEEKFYAFKYDIREKIELWFQVFDIDFAYEKAKKIPNMLVYSHRISGWSNPAYKLTNDINLQIKTNFGYGRASYFFSILKFKNIQIIPFSEWIKYQYAKYSDIIRYTKDFSVRESIMINGTQRLVNIKIENSFWIDAISYTQNAANLSLTDENAFIKKYIIDECEEMIHGLENIYKNSKLNFYNRSHILYEKRNVHMYNVDIKGYELIDFRTEKIIGALDFIDKISEYDTIISTKIYRDKIQELTYKFIPNVYTALKNQRKELFWAENDYKDFLPQHEELIIRNQFYDSEKLKLGFYKRYSDEYERFRTKFLQSVELEKQKLQKIKLHNDNINKLTYYIDKYKIFAKTNNSDIKNNFSN